MAINAAAFFPVRGGCGLTAGDGATEGDFSGSARVDEESSAPSVFTTAGLPSLLVDDTVVAAVADGGGGADVDLSVEDSATASAAGGDGPSPVDACP